MFWKSHFCHDHLNFIMAYTVECFWVVDETQIQCNFMFLALLNDVRNVDYLISSPPSFSKPWLSEEISSSSLNFILLVMIRSMILLTCEIRLIVREFEHSFRFPFLGSWIDAALHRSFGHQSSHQMFLQNCQGNLTPSSPDASQNSAWMLSAPGDFLFRICCKACSTSDLKGGGSSCSLPRL